MPLIEDLYWRLDTHVAVITDLVCSRRSIAEGPGNPKSRPIAFTADIESPKK